MKEAQLEEMDGEEEVGGPRAGNNKKRKRNDGDDDFNDVSVALTPSERMHFQWYST